MVAITIESRRIRADGHAADVAGCAAVSAILYALAGALENLSAPVRWRIESGCAEIPIPDSPEGRMLKLMAEVGLRQIADARTDVCVRSAQ